ncbi:glycosyl hydrolase [Actinoplanes sp. NEAU-A12]|uniref:Glycosyl hydrolase n=1 Tax=Actinoplanes sandaracinus TaxID=3045177 RepID=A0ABT6X0H5_9ACTN|nr:glycosyl hydrolase [Actinoplanes sandaracinus]MDI6105521.1 glycosyl hydrolase [Actinoplanes sandaracinus]
MTAGNRRAPGVSRRNVLGLAGLGVASATGLLGLWKAAARDSPATVSGTPAASAAPAAPLVTPAPFAQATDPGKLGGSVPFVAGKAMLGSYLSLDGKSYPEAVKLRREQLGRDQRITHVFYAWPDRLPNRIEGMPKKSVPLVSWRAPRYQKILSGASDDLIAAAARRIRDLGRPTLLRWGWEMNGRWYEWSGFENKQDTEGYVTCFRRLRQIFDDEGAGNVSWVWSPNWNSAPPEAWNRMDAYYPGDEYVDWVGVSGYNLSRESPATLFDPVYTAYSARKPIMITEVGAKDHGGTSKEDWIRDFSAYVGQRPAIGGVVWFDTDTHDAYSEHWRFDTRPESAAVYREMAGSDRFSG